METLASRPQNHFTSLTYAQAAHTFNLQHAPRQHRRATATQEVVWEEVMSNKPKITSWIVKMKCTVTKEVICDSCTEQEATDEPFSHSVDERETGMEDWEVTDIEPNT